MLNYDIGNFNLNSLENLHVYNNNAKNAKKCELQIHAQRNIMHGTFILQQFF